MDANNYEDVPELDLEEFNSNDLKEMGIIQTDQVYLSLRPTAMMPKIIHLDPKIKHSNDHKEYSLGN